ncbi:Gfo/Idh/MocA family oxidoreductase [Pseudomonas sp. CAN2814]|uniref:Gfo/Idh/MocA family protein n=1 Tax=Pseudomonas sp. CAN1 TaxID=3046726 RepID=UPI002649C5FA|nr:Gfo/Idh/MocA family oxidoreductase [Pseudomonas sp. CAN1]MDN6858962.1 Gfo/Idh/MocA family oxidoreductase [Pseudomonas sp. CAN1]
MPNLTADIPAKPRLRAGMIGGGEGAYFASYHRAAMRLCNRFELAAGVFSSSPAKSREAGRALGIDDERIYPSVQAMAAAERGRRDTIDVVVVVTPNHLHFEACQAFLAAGIPVICDKPLVNRLGEVDALLELVRRQPTFFGVTYTYLGYPMVREARSRILAGELGEIRFVQAEYLLEWLCQGSEGLSDSLAWRGDPAKAGPTSVVGDIGTHAFSLMELVTGQRCRRLNANLSTRVPGWPMDDHCVAQLEFDGGADGLMWLSFAAPGHRNGLSLRVIGSKASLEWRQETPETLHVRPVDGAERIYRRGQADNHPHARASSSLPAGCSEGYLEALAVLYADFAEAMATDELRPGIGSAPLPGIAEGARGVQFCHACLQSSQERSWVELPTVDAE